MVERFVAWLQFFVLRPLDNYICGDATSGTELCCKLNPLGIEYGYEIIENGVGDVFIKDPIVAEALQIHLKTFQFDAFLGGDIVERQFSKIRLACFRAYRSEFGANNFDFVITVWKPICKSL